MTQDSSSNVQRLIFFKSVFSVVFTCAWVTVDSPFLMVTLWINPLCSVLVHYFSFCHFLHKLFLISLIFLYISNIDFQCSIKFFFNKVLISSNPPSDGIATLFAWSSRKNICKKIAKPGCRCL